MGYYQSLREYIDVLDSDGKLVRIKSELSKDTEIIPLVRWQFRGLPEDERKAFLFENVTDAKGRKYNGTVLTGAHGASRRIYALAMMCRPEEILKKWELAELHPIAPQLVKVGTEDEVHSGKGLLEHGGLDEFPWPIFTPGFDPAPYVAGGCWITKDPDSGITNVGTYRGMIKSQTRIGCNALPPKHLGIHWAKYQKMGKPLPAAIVIGAAPNIGLVSVTKLPYNGNEYAVAGGVAGEPVKLVKCKTVDLEVPATAEIVIEGEMPTDYLEREAPFGEYTGYFGMERMNTFLNVTCISHKRRPICNSFISQFPPSESSIIRGIGTEAIYYKFLKNDLSLPELVDVGFHHESGGNFWCVVSLKKGTSRTQVWRALNGAVALEPLTAKIVVAVDDDIDPRDADSIIWALCYGMQPDRDIRVTPGKSAGLDPSAVPPEDREAKPLQRPLTSAIMIDATRKWDYPPISLPGKEFMERAKKIWEAEGLPPLRPKSPWHGLSLGHWTEENEEEAELAVRGDYYETGNKLAQRRKKIV